MIPPVVGWADNGDFPKVLARFDLYPVVSEGVYEYAGTHYSFQPARHWESGFQSTEVALAWLAIQLNSLISKDGTFDLRVIGFVHGALYFAAFWLFAPLLADSKRWARILIYALTVLFFCDVMYVCGLNSFYMDEPALVFGLLSIVFYLRVIRWHRPMDAIGLMVCPLLLVGAKAQYTLPGFFIAALFIVGDQWLWPGGRWRFTAAGVILAVFAGYMYLEGSPPDYAGYSAFNVVFLADSAGQQGCLTNAGGSWGSTILIATKPAKPLIRQVQGMGRPGFAEGLQLAGDDQERSVSSSRRIRRICGGR